MTDREVPVVCLEGHALTHDAFDFSHLAVEQTFDFSHLAVEQIPQRCADEIEDVDNRAPSTLVSDGDVRSLVARVFARRRDWAKRTRAEVEERVEAFINSRWPCAILADAWNDPAANVWNSVYAASRSRYQLLGCPDGISSAIEFPSESKEIATCAVCGLTGEMDSGGAILTINLVASPRSLDRQTLMSPSSYLCLFASEPANNNTKSVTGDLVHIPPACDDCLGTLGLRGGPVATTAHAAATTQMMVPPYGKDISASVLCEWYSTFILRHISTIVEDAFSNVVSKCDLMMGTLSRYLPMALVDLIACFFLLPMNLPTVADGGDKAKTLTTIKDAQNHMADTDNKADDVKVKVVGAVTQKTAVQSISAKVTAAISAILALPALSSGSSIDLDMTNEALAVLSEHTVRELVTQQLLEAGYILDKTTVKAKMIERGALAVIAGRSAMVMSYGIISLIMLGFEIQSSKSNLCVLKLSQAQAQSVCKIRARDAIAFSVQQLKMLYQPTLSWSEATDGCGTYSVFSSSAESCISISGMS